jgi:crotonobetainyl-CoA:carnitine CoA-transferase CaiB-like acyl-CoA transferase
MTEIDENSITTDGALVGLRVVELGTMLAAPLTGMLLADHGANVIKVEMPGSGDQLRAWGQSKNDQGLTWKMVGRNKRTVTLDLHSETDRERFRRLVSTADVLIENFRPGTLERWDIGPDVLMAENERLIVLRVTGWGQAGPYAQRPGFGTLVEAFSGFAFINGWEDRPPTLPPLGLADSMAGFVGAFGVLAALHARARTGCGQVVDLALYEPMLTSLGSMIVEFDQLGEVQQRAGNRAPMTAPRNAYECKDGLWLALSGSNQATAMRLLHEVGGTSLTSDERFATNHARLEHCDALDDLIAEWAGSRTLEDALAALHRAEVAACAVNSVADLMSDEHLLARDSVVGCDDEDVGRMRVPAPIPRLMSTPAVIRHLGRSLGADNDILTEADPW